MSRSSTCLSRPTHVLWASQSDSGNAWNSDETELKNGLSGLLLSTRCNESRVSGGGVLSSINLGIGVIFLLCDNVLVLNLLVWELLNAWVGHRVEIGLFMKLLVAARELQWTNFDEIACVCWAFAVPRTSTQ